VLYIYVIGVYLLSLLIYYNFNFFSILVPYNFIRYFLIEFSITDTFLGSVLKLFCFHTIL
jgi:hypothetical protein